MKSTEKVNNVIVLNKLPSNIIKEAIIVLRREYNFETIKNKNMKENIIREAEDVILDFIKESENEKDRKKILKLQKKYQICKYIIGVLVLSLLMSLWI